MSQLPLRALSMLMLLGCSACVSNSQESVQRQIGPVWNAGAASLRLDTLIPEAEAINRIGWSPVKSESGVCGSSPRLSVCRALFFGPLGNRLIVRLEQIGSDWYVTHWIVVP